MAQNPPPPRACLVTVTETGQPPTEPAASVSEAHGPMHCAVFPAVDVAVCRALATAGDFRPGRHSRPHEALPEALPTTLDCEWASGSPHCVHT